MDFLHGPCRSTIFDTKEFLMMNALTQRLSALFAARPFEKCSSAAYAIMIDGQITAETDGPQPHPRRQSQRRFHLQGLLRGGCHAAGRERPARAGPPCSAEYLPRFWMPDERYKRSPSATARATSCGLPGTQWRWLAASRPRRDEDYYE